MKFLIWVLLLALVAFLLGVKRARPRRAEPPPAAPPPPSHRNDGLEAMVSCAECGTHLPASEALPGRGGQFCSAAHRAAHEARLG